MVMPRHLNEKLLSGILPDPNLLGPHPDDYRASDWKTANALTG
jgi:hypothetical protein